MEQELQRETTVHNSFLLDDFLSEESMETDYNSVDWKLFFETWQLAIFIN
jgi:hypothetical protein